MLFVQFNPPPPPNSPIHDCFNDRDQRLSAANCDVDVFNSFNFSLIIYSNKLVKTSHFIFQLVVISSMIS